MSTVETLERPAVEEASNPYLQGNFAPITVETTAFDLPVKGRIPEVLAGRYLRIGPNPIWPVDPKTYHWFTGSGMAHGLRLRGGKAEGTATAPWSPTASRPYLAVRACPVRATASATTPPTPT